MNEKQRKLFCPDWCPKKLTKCNFECYEWEENSYNNKNEHTHNWRRPMNTQELLNQLKKDAEIFTLEQLKAQLDCEPTLLCPSDSTDYSFRLLSLSNVKMMIQLKESEQVGELFTVNEEKLQHFQEDLCKYMDTFLPNESEFKKYILIIATYLLFIKKIPFHYPGMKMDGKNEIFFDGHVYRCPVKQKYISEEGSLCKYCVAIPYAKSTDP